MNKVQLFSNLMKLQPQPTPSLVPIVISSSNTKNANKSAVAQSNEKSTNATSNDTSENQNKQTLNYGSDLICKVDHLQQLSTNSLPPYFPTSPPDFVKLDMNTFEFHCCSDCGDTFALKTSLNFHLERRSALIKFPCDTCKSICVFYNRCSLLSHVRTHTDKNEQATMDKATVSPLPRIFMDGLRNEAAEEEQSAADVDNDAVSVSELLECSFKEIEDNVASPAKDKSPVSAESPKYKCWDCNELFVSDVARREHLTNGDKVPSILHQCNKCNMICPSKCSLKAHQRIHIQVSPYVCPECGASPDFFWLNFQNHVVYKCFHFSRSVGYKCSICKAVSPNEDALLKHMELHTQKYLKCDSCPRAYISRAAFDAHCKENHAKDIDKTIHYNIIYKCSLCDIVFLGFQQMKDHRSVHLKQQTSEYVFNCMQCSKSMENKAKLLDHIKNTHPNIYKYINDITADKATTETQATVIQCLVCGIDFQTLQNYNLHMCSNHLYTNEPCNYCFMVIANNKAMVQHGKKHLAKNAIICLLCKNKSFAEMKYLESHLRKHVSWLKGSTYCPLCKDTLLHNHQEAFMHLKKEHGIKSAMEKRSDSEVSKDSNLSCFFCKAPFETQDELEKHLETAHTLPGPDENEPKAKKAKIVGNVCAKCDFHSEDRVEFKTHITTHKTNQSTYQCQECGLCFVVEPALQKHLKIIHRIKDVRKYIDEEGTNFSPEEKGPSAEVFSCDSLICSVCFTTFPTEGALNTHMRSHGLAFIQANKMASAS